MSKTSQAKQKLTPGYVPTKRAAKSTEKYKPTTVSFTSLMDQAHKANKSSPVIRNGGTTGTAGAFGGCDKAERQRRADVRAAEKAA